MASPGTAKIGSNVITKHGGDSSDAHLFGQPDYVLHCHFVPMVNLYRLPHTEGHHLNARITESLV